MTGGNIEAIRDWANQYYYNRDDLANFFILKSQGLTAYKITIIGPKNCPIHIIEDALTNPQEYTVQTDRYGVFSGLLFFRIQPINLTLTNLSTHDTVTQALTTGVFEYTIQMSPYVIAYPDMTSNTTPNDKGEVIYGTDLTNNVTNMWWLFQPRVQHTNSSGYAPRIYLVNPYTEEGRRREDAWVGYDFDEPTVIYKAEWYVYGFNTNLNLDHILEGSFDGTTWTELGRVNKNGNASGYNGTSFYAGSTPSVTITVQNPLAYKYYRFKVVNTDQTYTSYGTYQLVNDLVLYTI